MKVSWQPILEPYVYGSFTRGEHWTVEVIRCSPADWAVFARLDGETAVMSRTRLPESMRAAYIATYANLLGAKAAALKTLKHLEAR